MTKQIPKRHSLWRKILLIAFAFAVIYIGYGYHLSVTTQDVLLSALNAHNYVTNNPYSDIIHDKNYNHLIPNKHANYDTAGAHSDIHCKKPIVLHWFTGAQVWSQYDYTYYQNGEEMTHLSNVTVKLTYKKQDGLWRVIDCSISPSLTGA